MTRVALYARVSTEEQARKGMSIKAQLSSLRKWVDEKGYEVAGEYVDPGQSGRDDKRPQFERMMWDAEWGRFDVVAVSKLDRFMRNLAKMCQILDQLGHLEIGFVPLDYPQLDTSSAVGKMVLSVLGSLAQFESDRIGERVRDSRDKLIEVGRWPAGRVIYGYRWDVKARRFDVIDEEVKVIRHIFDWYVNGNLGIVPIATRLNQEGYRTRPKRTRKDDDIKPRTWHISAVYHILKEHRFTGQDDHFTFPEIIDKALFDAAQRKLKQARPIRRDPGRWLLQGYCICGLCGHGLACRQKYEGGPRRYECRGTMKMSHVDGSDKCTLKSIPAEALDKVAWQRFAQVASDDKLLRQSIEKALRMLETRESQLNKTGSIEAELMDIGARKERLWTAYEDGGMPKDRFLSRVEALNANEEKLERRREQLDPTASYELAKLEDHITTIKQVLENGKITIGNSGVGGLTFDRDMPLTYMHDLQDLWEGKAGEEKDMPAANWEFRNAENGVKFSCSAEWWDWANKEEMRRKRQLLERFRITVVVLPDRIEIKGVIPDQVIQRQRDQVFYSG